MTAVVCASGDVHGPVSAALAHSSAVLQSRLGQET
eukprot:CAMPEP_0119106314 /NCGR_PEP_ID=MMETSP1180-20130426/4042_1 /TAXON_ID=3052 ORGANISM="Chlamydomonas cf sp, Strain CCMP681" /NCGR_SAMPLE_ID=MMETSP1180 /ASSEMBLY_ACC=CAM_ASM_000741 /LENGTH=34 /DNA_ID= /DNA_START= /DNA_END= /DNA_ORIENTATION=